MKNLISTIILCCVALVVNAQEVVSPNGKLSAKTTDKKLVINYNQQQVLELADIEFGELKFVRQVKDDYQMLEGKRLHCTNEANEYQGAIGPNAKIVMRLYNDGIAFRYEYTNLQNCKVPAEQTAYVIHEGTKRWMQQWSDGYEGFFPMTTTAEVKTLGGFGGSIVQKDVNTHWGYPLLMEPADGVFALITEANIERRQSASSLFNKGEVFNVVQDQNDLLLTGDWHTPWRVVIIGTLADVVQSTLVTDVSEPSKFDDTNWIKPGVVSWIYWAYNHGSNDYNIIKKYVDMAVTLKLPYVLIDAEWDEMDKVASNEGKTIEDAVAYAVAKGVKPLIWYNSSIGWIDGAPGPKFRLNKLEDREKEFAWCEKIGVAGVKIDFFSGDNQANMDYCQDLLESAARHHLLVNFHGAPIPRGWQRTYPNLLSTEGVYGAEWYNNVPHFTKKAASHNATLPFTRNVIGPMDYTPCAFSDSQHPHITSNAHELALTVLYESGLQHLADRPESFLAQPQAVQDFLGKLPTVWDETRFVSGYPGESAVLARRSGNTWYVAGINGSDEPKTLATDLSFIGKGTAQLFADDTNNQWQISTISTLPTEISCQPRGGFVLVINKLYSDEFPLRDVTLLDGPLKKASDLNLKTLLQYDCDRLLAPYRKEAGLKPRAKTYPNWDGLDGHVGGHYLTAMAQNAATGNDECKRRMAYMISELQLCADANAKNHPDWGKGYVGGMPNSERIWSTFKKGDFSVYFGSWAPFYNLHKMYAGLRDAWFYCGNEQAKQLFLGFCDWAIDLTSGLSDEQMEQMLNNEHGGMNEVLADAYAITNDTKYLLVAKRFSHRRLLTPMSQRQDCLDNMHANTQVPKVVGFERISELSGNETYHNAADYFWDIVTGERSLAFGGNSRREHFPSKEACTDFINDIDGPESCNTNNMLKLTEELHHRNPEARYADYYELATFNHILSSQHPEHGGYVYFTPARPRHYRNYSAPNEAMWCCVGTGMENHGKYGQFIYTHAGNALYVNLFVASELNWREKGITLRQETAFPYGETSRITIMGSEKSGVKGEKFPLLVRYPGWVKPGDFSVKVNGQAVEIITGPSSYVTIDRQWKKGDVVEVTFPMHNSIKYLPNVPQYIALMHGPILLGMKTGTEDLAHLVADDSRFGQYASGKKLPINEAPILINNDIENIANQLKPIAGKPLHFTLSTKMEHAIRNELQPFFEIHDSRYMIYWLALSEENYQGYLDALAKAEQERQALETRTIDKVQPGEQQPETDHKMETDQSYTGNTNDVFWRDARDNHYFSYLMQTEGRTDLSLRLKFWGVGEWKTHEFDIFIDDQMLTSVNNTGKYRISEFKYELFDIPAELLQGKSQIRVKFVAKPGKQIGEIYGVRLIKTL